MGYRAFKAKEQTGQLPVIWPKLAGWQLFIIFGLLAMGGYFLIPTSNPGLLNFYFATFNLLPIGAILWAGKKLSKVQRLAWYLIATGLGFWAAGEYLWAYYSFSTGSARIPYPSLSDGLFELYYPFIIAGVWLLARGRSRMWNIGILIDAALVTLSGAILLWNFFVTPHLQGTDLSLLQILTSISVPLFDLLLLSIGVIYLLLPGKRSPAYYFLAFSLFLNLISDTVYGFAMLSGTYYTGHPLTAGWMLGFICWGATILHPSRASLGELNPAEGNQPGRLRFVLLGAASVLGPGLFIAQEILQITINVPLLVISSAALFVLVIARLAVMVHRYEAMANELKVQAVRQAELVNFSQEALAVASLGDLFEDIVNVTCRALKVEFSVILELRSDGNRQIFKWATNLNDSDKFTIPALHSPGLLSGRVVTEKRAIIIKDWVGQSEYKPTSFILANHIKSSLAVPVFERESAVFGVLLAHSTRSNQFTPNEAAFLQALAGVAAAAIERKRVEDALHEESDFGLQVMNNMGQGLIVEDANRIVQFVNPVMARMLGFETGELLGRSTDVFLSEKTRTTMPRIMGKRKEGINSQVEVVLRRKDGQEFYAQVTGVPIIKDAVLEKVILVINDITERKEAEEEMQKALAKEKELGELKSRFVSATSHEFRTPLTSIMTSAELLEHYSQRFSEEKRQEILQRIQTSVKYMSELLNDILTIGRADAGKLQYNPVLLDLVAESREALDEVKFELTGQHRVEFTVRGTPAVGQFDPISYKRILVNLLSNAIKYSPEGGLIGLALSYCSQGEVEIRVSDQGIGILPEDREHLFEVFHRGGNVGTLAGTGLGLSIVKHSVELQNGTVEVSSVPGTGTTFTVTMPLHPPVSTPEMGQTMETHASVI